MHPDGRNHNRLMYVSRLKAENTLKFLILVPYTIRVSINKTAYFNQGSNNGDACDTVDPRVQ